MPPPPDLGKRTGPTRGPVLFQSISTLRLAVLAPPKGVAAGPADTEVETGPAVQEVVAAQPDKDVVAAETADDVGAGGSGQDVRAGGADHLIPRIAREARAD